VEAAALSEQTMQATSEDITGSIKANVPEEDYL
jgi:hypothetical protein